MEIALALVVLAAAVAVLAYPLYRERPKPLIVAGSSLDDVNAQRDGLYATLRDLDMDHRLGKIDDADYTALREKYMAQAAVVLHELDVLRGQGSGAAAGAEIEHEVAALRRKKTKAKDKPEKAPPTQAAPQDTPARFCANCGRAYHAGDKFCAHCGHALR